MNVVYYIFNYFYLYVEIIKFIFNPMSNNRSFILFKLLKHKIYDTHMINKRYIKIKFFNWINRIKY